MMASECFFSNQVPRFARMKAENPRIGIKITKVLVSRFLKFDVVIVTLEVEMITTVYNSAVNCWCELVFRECFRVGSHSLGAVGVHLVVLPHMHDKPGTHANNFHMVGYYILLAFDQISCSGLFLHYILLHYILLHYLINLYYAFYTYFAIDGNYPSKVHTEAVRSQSSR